MGMKGSLKDMGKVTRRLIDTRHDTVGLLEAPKFSKALSEVRMPAMRFEPASLAFD